MLLLADASGRVRAFAKVGWDRATQQLVGNEAWALTAMVRRAPLEMPSLLEDFWFNGNRIVVQSAVRVGRTGRHAIDSGRLASVVGAIAGPGVALPLADTAYASALLERSHSSGTMTPSSKQAIADVLQRNGAIRVATGAWHGDLTPWNSSLLKDAVSVWDWERWAPDVPVGLDVLHYHLRLRHAAAEPWLALDHARAVAGPALERLGVPRAAHVAVQECHVAELIIRFCEDPAMKELVASLTSAVHGRQEPS